MESEIKINISLDETRTPEKITWQATESGIDSEKECKSFLLSVWDKADPGTLRIDLWTKDMMVDEMQHFVYQTIRTLADTYVRATHDKLLGEEIRQFADDFGKKIQQQRPS